MSARLPLAGLATVVQPTPVTCARTAGAGRTWRLLLGGEARVDAANRPARTSPGPPRRARRAGPAAPGPPRRGQGRLRSCTFLGRARPPRAARGRGIWMNLFRAFVALAAAAIAATNLTACEPPPPRLHLTVTTPSPEATTTRGTVRATRRPPEDAASRRPSPRGTPESTEPTSPSRPATTPPSLPASPATSASPPLRRHPPVSVTAAASNSPSSRGVDSRSPISTPVGSVFRGRST